jgi:hypothetical protein
MKPFLDYLPNTKKKEEFLGAFPTVVAVFVFYQEGYYSINNPVWIVLSLFYKYPTKLLH